MKPVRHPYDKVQHQQHNILEGEEGPGQEQNEDDDVNEDGVHNDVLILKIIMTLNTDKSNFIRTNQ